MLMYMTRVKLNTAKRKTLFALSNPNLFHGALCQAFDDPREKKLWRIDQLVSGIYLLIVSSHKPELQTFVTQFGFEEAANCWQYKVYDPFIDKLREDSKWHFRLVACPTHSVMDRENPDAKRGKVYPHVTPKYQKQWLLDRCEKHGMELSDDSFQIMADRTFSFKKTSSNRKVTLLSVTFEGTLKITNVDLFKELLIQGIGRGKGYGLGLLTIAGQIK